MIDQQIRVLLLEGDPYWDTTFLQRSLMRNDKFDVDALIRYGPNHVRAIRKTPGTGELHLPETLDQLAAYDVVILGRAVDSLSDSGQKNPSGQFALLSAGQSAGGRLSFPDLLDQFVKDRGGTVIFSRGRAFQNSSPEGLEPVLWSDQSRDHVHLDTTAEGRGLSPFQVLNGGEGGVDTLPDLVDAKTPRETQPLTSMFAVAAGRDDANPHPAIVHRRYGQGQVVSIGVDGLWRWSLNAKIEGANSPFDRFWDQMILWLLAGRDFIPNRQFSFRPEFRQHLAGRKGLFPAGPAAAGPKNQIRAGDDLFRRRRSRTHHARSRARQHRPAHGGISAGTHRTLPGGRESAGRHHAGIALHRVHGKSGGNRGGHGRALSAAAVRSQRRAAACNRANCRSCCRN